MKLLASTSPVMKKRKPLTAAKKLWIARIAVHVAVAEKIAIK